MKRKDFLALKQKTVKELTKDLDEKRHTLAKYLMERKVKQIKNTRQKVTISDDLARILTLIKEKEILQKHGDKKK